MATFNKVILVGRLTKDPETHQFGENSVTKFGLAVNEKFRDQEKTHFFDCEAWGKTGEVIAKFCGKGKEILVDGSLQHDTWEKDGQKRSAVRIKVWNFQFLGGPKDGDGGSSSGGYKKPDSAEIPF